MIGLPGKIGGHGSEVADMMAHGSVMRWTASRIWHVSAM
jgi:hypothetical protein